ERARRRAVELVADEGLVARDPGVVPRLDDVRIAGREVGLGAVVVNDVHRAGDDRPDVMVLTTVGARDRLDALRPAPARLEAHAGRLDASEVDDLHARLRWCTHLIGRAEALLPDPRHRNTS